MKAEGKAWGQFWGMGCLHNVLGLGGSQAAARVGALGEGEGSCLETRGDAVGTQTTKPCGAQEVPGAGARLALSHP